MLRDAVTKTILKVKFYQSKSIFRQKVELLLKCQLLLRGAESFARSPKISSFFQKDEWTYKLTMEFM